MLIRKILKVFTKFSWSKLIG